MYVFICTYFNFREDWIFFICDLNFLCEVSVMSSEHSIVVFLFSMCFQKIIAIIITKCRFPQQAPESM